MKFLVAIALAGLIALGEQQMSPDFTGAVFSFLMLSVVFCSLARRIG